MSQTAGTSRRALRLLLWLYPAAFRRTFGDDVVDTHVDLLRAARADGRRRWLFTAALIVADLVYGAAREWWDGARPEGGPQPASARNTSSLGARMMASLSDLRSVGRTLVRQPGFTLPVVLTLALGIGANTAVFSLIDAVLLHPLPVDAPESLVVIHDATSPDRAPAGGSYPLLRELAAGNHSLAGVAGYDYLTVAVDVDGHATLTPAAVVSGNYFGLVGVRPQLGRLIDPADDEVPLGGPVAVISNTFWTREFGRDASVIGRTMRLGPTVFRVVGVTAPGFRGHDLAEAPEIWVPMKMVQGLDVGGFLSGPFSRTLFTTFRYGWMQMIGRLRAGVTIEEATADLSRVMEASRAARAPSASKADAQPHARALLTPLTTAAVSGDHDATVRFIAMLAGVMALLLLLACSNVTSLLVARGAERTRELGLRTALGASPGRLVRLLFSEHALLAAAAGVTGVAIGALGMRMLAAFSLPGGVDIGELGLSLHPRILTFTAGLSAVTVLVFGLVPAIRASRLDVARVARLQVRGALGRAPVSLVGVQVALSLVILVAAGLFLRSLHAGLDTDIGFDASAVSAASVEPRLHGYSNARAADFYKRVLDRLRQAPGVAAAAVGTSVPVTPVLLRMEVRPVAGARPGAAVEAGRAFVSPGYFATLGVNLIDGRDFDASDRPGTSLVTIVNAAAAGALWPGERAVGRQFVDETGRAYTVIGVAADTKYESLADEKLPFVFFSMFQENVSGRASILARTDRAEAGPGALRSSIAAADPGVAIVNERRLDLQVARLLAPQRFGTVLLSGCGVLALVIAAMGLYASLAYATARRRLELGIRLALGAPPTRLVRQVFTRAAVGVTVGAVTGLVVAMLGARALTPFLVRIPPLDLPALLGALAVLAGTVAAAAYVPARRVARTDPVRALRAD